MSIASLLKLRRQRGLTLVEMIIFIVIISIASVGVLVVMNITSRHSGDAQLRKQALSIAEGILEEIEMARFTYCDPQDINASTAQNASVIAGNPLYCNSVLESVGPETGNARPFDNVNDYVPTNGSLGTPFAFNLNDVNNAGIPNIVGAYAASVTISQATLSGLETDTGANPAIGSVLRINVIVTYGDQKQYSVVLDGYRTQYSPNLMPVPNQ